MKTGEMIKELTENPEKEFISKVNKDIKAKRSLFTDDIELYNHKNKTKIVKLGVKVLNGEWEEVKESVDFMTAVKSGKKIRVEHINVDDRGVDDLIDFTSLDCLIYALGEGWDAEEVKDIILNDKWYIEQGDNMLVECSNCIYFNKDDTFPETGFCTLWSDYVNEEADCDNWEEE